jgi:hypothetical protein
MIASTSPVARVTDGEATINAILRRPGVVVLSARSCYFDGFADDTHTEYANPSIYRTDSVRRAGLVSSVWTGRLLDLHYGPYYVGVVMYDSAGDDEEMTVSIGARQLGTLRADRHDNRRHLYTFPQKFDFRGSEVIRLVTAPTRGLYRIENIVLLPSLPDESPNDLMIADARIDLRPVDAGRSRAVVTWLTNRPSLGEVAVSAEGSETRTVREETALVNHEVVVDNLPGDCSVVARILARPAPRTGLPADRAATAEVTSAPRLLPPPRAFALASP